MTELPIFVDESEDQAGSRLYLITSVFHDRGIGFNRPTRALFFSNWGKFKKNYLRKIQKHLL